VKTTGLIGGMSWQSTIPYYRTLNEAIAQAAARYALGD
jgi:aspartate racemase